MNRSANELNSPLSKSDAPALLLERRLLLRHSPDSHDPVPPSPDPPSAGRAGDDDVFHLGLRIVYRRRWVAAAIFLATTMVGIAYLFSATPTYEASVRLLIQPDNPNVVAFKDVVDQGGSAVEYTRRGPPFSKAARWRDGRWIR